MSRQRMTYGEWVIYWRERLPISEGYFSPPGRAPKRMNHNLAIAYYTIKLKHAWRKEER